MYGTDAPILHPAIQMPDPPEMPKGMKVDVTHDALLDYLLSRAKKGRDARDNRIIRFARIDKSVATWKKLNVDDQKRDELEEATGEPQAITSVIPIIHTHLEDMGSFYAGVFSPNARDFYALPKPEATDALTALVGKMNADAKYCQYYFNLASMVRTILKYNIAGFHIAWKETVEPGAVKLAGNHIESLDMYNTFWDPSVKSPSRVAVDAEWAGEVRIQNRYTIVKEARAKGWWRIDDVIEKEDSEVAEKSRKADFYRFPPQDSVFASEVATADALLDTYFAGLDSKTPAEIVGHEVMRLYCRLNPAEWDLIDLSEESDIQDELPEYQLWKFTIINATQIVHAERVKTLTNHIPLYIGHLNVDEMGEASKSIAELLKSFQGFVSFLFNIHVQGARGAIWGFTGVNPKFYDTTKIRRGDVAGLLIMRDEVAQAHINPNLGIARIQSNAADTRATMTDVSSVMSLLQMLFPSQNLPSQIAGIDRAVESQVAAVLQGVNRRLHMLANLLDSQILHPLRMAAYYNIGLNAAAELKQKLTGLGYEDVTTALGSGLKQMNREAAAKAMERVLFALIQSPQTLKDKNIDVLALMDYWADLLELDIDLTQFQNQQPPAQVPGQEGAAGAPTDSEEVAGPAPRPALVA